MKTHLSHVMPVWQACEILGEPTVMRIGSSLLRLRESANKHQQPQGASSAASTSQPPIGIANYSTNANAAAVVFEQEMQTLTAALFYQPPIVRHLAVATIDPLEDPTGSLRQQQLQQQEPNVPTHIAASWKRWLKAKALQLDKATLLPFLVPHSVQPSSAGHIGLFDCLVYALQGHANNNKTNNSSSSASTSYYGSSSYTSTTAATANNNTNNIIWIPDVLILLAICKQYSDHRRAVSMRNREQQQQQSNNNDDDDEKNDSKNKPATKKSSAAPPQPPTEKDNAVVWTMAVLTYRIFDSYMKNGTVTRDTVHRFMTDIYGDESYKRPNASALLDAMFYNDPLPPPSDNNNHPSGGGNHGLQANVTEAVFCRRCLDTVRPETGSHLLLDWLAVLGNAMLPLPRIPASITAYLEAMNYTRPPLCQVYDLADHRLYEIKRRFHSMVQQQQHGCMASSSLIQGDPMTTSSTAPEGTNGGSTAASLSSSSLSSTTAMDSAASRQVISQGAFCHAISSANEEMGTGGYLPVALATLVFRAGLEGNDFAGVPGLTSGNQSVGWGLYQLPILDHDTNTPLQPDLEFEDDKNVLSRRHVSNMLLGLVEHLEFRRQSDCNALDIDEDDGVIDCQTKPDADFEAQSVNLSTAAALNLVQPPNGSKPNDTIQLRALTDACMAYANAKDRMTFDEFCSWSKASVEGAPSTKKSTQTRLASLILELRLIAGVKFGVPPTSAGVEVTLIAEIERRHKKRYPHSEVSRRGPRGTVWNIIDAAWFKEWATLVNKVMGTRDDSLDGRGDPRNDRVRGLSRISNTSLLVENGSLSIRPDIRWKHDYELIPPLAWSALQAWYDGGPPIHRSVVKYIENSGTSPSPHSARSAPLPTENEIELYPYFVTLYLCDSTSRGEARPFQQNYQMSRVSPIIVMLVQLSKELDVSPDSLRLWVIGSATGAVGTVSADTHDDHRGGDDWILSTDLNIVEQRKRRGVSMDISITLLLEIKDRESGLWPRGADGKDWTFRDTSVPLPTPTDLGDGVVGLYNMGNTCYLNASIQCLSHTPILREYFTSKAFYKDINKTNPLGHEGRLAQVSSVLINELWKRSYQTTIHQPKRVTAPGSYSPLTQAPALTPKTFKESLGKFNDLFAGNEQHDAQELLAFLLGGLSEDLNRIVEKPYMEAPDSDGRPDGELADIWWSNHLKREMSIIVALFTGQYKSLLTCRTCKYESARFEPFSFLQLPLPEDEHLTVSLTFYPAIEGVAAMKYCVRVRNEGTLRDVLVALAKILYQDETDEKDGVHKQSHEEEAGVETETEDDMFIERSRNMAIVVMREGYIVRMAANTWLLQDQQNKETGELPPLFVYELDPIQNNGLAADQNVRGAKPISDLSSEDFLPVEDGYSSGIVQPTTPSPAFLAVAQRRSGLVSRDFLHPLAHRVFGTPLLLRINDIDNCTGSDLYNLVAKRLKSVVPKPALRFLASPKNDNDRKPSAQTTHVLREGAFKTTTDMEEVAAGPVPRYGFRIRLTSRDGQRCLRCAWYECCVGCLVPDDDDVTIVGDGDSIVVDWHFAVDAATNGFGYRASGCDAIFASQPTISRVRPPISTIRSHSSCGIGPTKGKQIGAVTLEECLDAFAKEEKIPEAYCSKCKDFRVQTKRMSLWRLPPVMIIHLKRFQFTPTMRRKLRELVVFPTEGLDLSRIMAPDSSGSDHATKEAVERNASEELKDDGRSEMLYDLYGVIHHQGALSGGHYVASLKSELDGQWRLFNDAQIYEIHARDVVDPSAYILFYIRRDVAKAKLSDYWDVQQGGGIRDEDIEQLAKGRSDRCVIS